MYHTLFIHELTHNTVVSSLVMWPSSLSSKLLNTEMISNTLTLFLLNVKKSITFTTESFFFFWSSVYNFMNYKFELRQTQIIGWNMFHLLSLSPPLLSSLTLHVCFEWCPYISNQEVFVATSHQSNDLQQFYWCQCFQIQRKRYCIVSSSIETAHSGFTRRNVNT